MEKLKNKRILALVGIIGLIFGIMMPYFKVSVYGYTKTISLWGYWEGKVIFILTIAIGLIIFRDIVEKYAPQLFNNSVGKFVEKIDNPKYALIPTILVACYAIYLITKVDVSSQFVKYGLGFYVLWIGIISLFGHAFLYKKQNINTQYNQTSNGEQQIRYSQTSQPQNNQINNSQQQMGYNQINQTVQPQFNSTKKYCSNCGNQVSENASNCFMCGNKLM